MNIEVICTAGTAPEEGYEIRRKVFVEEQGVDPKIEFDELDGSSEHILVFAGGRAAGYGRVVLEGEKVRFTRIAVLRCMRGFGVGRAVVLEMLRCAARNNAQCVYLHSQLEAKGFYQKLGFTEYGEVFHEAGIPHISMKYTEGSARAHTH